MQFAALLLCFCFISPLFTATINEKVLICGIAKNVEHAIPNTIQSTEELGTQFLDYKVIIYENNSTDRTKQLFSEWASRNNRVTFLSENVIEQGEREERIARARNRVLDRAMAACFDDYKYVIMADLDILHPWDIENIVDSILHPSTTWDAILANGGYDLYALRTPEIPIGYELIGAMYWNRLDNAIRNKLSRLDYWNQSKPWIPVYSAFGGLGIYKRDSIKGCKYSAVVTKDLERTVLDWLHKASQRDDIPLLDDYKTLLREKPIFDIREDSISSRKKYPEYMGVRLFNSYGEGRVVWFSCEKRYSRPLTCEHIPFHASMAVRGHDKLFVNPKLSCNHP